MISSLADPTGLPDPPVTPLEGPLLELLTTVWTGRPPPVRPVRGRWRWKGSEEGLESVRAFLAQKMKPGTVPFDVERAYRWSLPPRDPSSRPCEIAVYPATVVGPSLEAADAEKRWIYLCLFYAIRSTDASTNLADRERAYFQVVETLDHLHDQLCRDRSGRTVRAIDLPMPGWMEAAITPAQDHTCPLVSG